MDPITTSLLVAQGIAGLGKTGYGMYQQRAGKRALAGVQEASRMKPGEYAEMLREAKKGQAVQNRIEEINRSLATSNEALQQSGSRAVIGGIGKVTQAGASAKNQLLAQQQQDIMRALGASAMGSERKIMRDTQREMQETRLAQAAINAGVQNTVSGLSDLGATAGYALALSKSKGEGEGDSKAFANARRATRLAQEGIRSDIERFEQPGGIPSVDDSLQFPELSLDGLEDIEAIDDDLEEFYNGGMVTDGPFNHDTNPIYMVQGGKMVGEMTGGEYVLNPSQAKAISKESKYFRNLLKQKRFK